MIAAEKSGAGKTVTVCALLSILSDMGFNVTSFKCGPDYIDPMFHKTVLDVPSYNLDSWFSDENDLRYLLGRHGTDDTCDGAAATCRTPEGSDERTYEETATTKDKKEKLAVLEGVMGYYDGLGISDRTSSYEVARLTGTPVILIVDASGRSLSALASIRGHLDFREDSMICGVIFNRLSPSRYPALKEAAESEFQDVPGFKVAGYIPEISDFTLPGRHLGLIKPDEIPDIREKIKKFAEEIVPGIDTGALIDIARSAGSLHYTERDIPFVRKKDGTPPVIAVAEDEAFCFYYEDNLETLKKMGADIIYFSPVHDSKIPYNADGVYLGGGYPELYAEELSRNTLMRENVRERLSSGLPCIAECGGYMYLKESIRDPEGREWPMAGVIPGNCADTGRLSRFGYGKVSLMKDGVLGRTGDTLPVHEFHHWDSEDNGDALILEKASNGSRSECGFMSDTLYAGFPHFYFYGHFPFEYVKTAALPARK